MASITVLLLPDHERTSTLKLTLPSSWRAKTVGALAKTLHRKHCASLGRDPSGEAALWSGGRPRYRPSSAPYCSEKYTEEARERARSPKRSPTSGALTAGSSPVAVSPGSRPGWSG